MVMDFENDPSLTATRSWRTASTTRGADHVGQEEWAGWIGWGEIGVPEAASVADLDYPLGVLARQHVLVTFELLHRLFDPLEEMPSAVATG